eukprot:GHVT01029670.1.p1 GENE.GHVT01029670.1~~GHVT01029670.1.p1  ORF type:complete len:418 (+),score=15.08 GHVT01029670.1:2862-4115(+)
MSRVTKSSFVSHQAVYRYLMRFAAAHNLDDCINYNHEIRAIRPIQKALTCAGPEASQCTWDVDGALFDIVIVANGHHNVPFVPKLHDDKFECKVMHSKSYDAPHRFQNQVVLVVGAGASGVDLLWEISSVARITIWSHPSFADAKEILSTLPPNATAIGEIEKVDENGHIHLTSAALASHLFCGGASLPSIDFMVYATGYVPSFPFFPDDLRGPVERFAGRDSIALASEHIPRVVQCEQGENATKPIRLPSEDRFPCGVQQQQCLYLNMVSVKYPGSLFFIGLINRVVPFALLEAQCCAALACVTDARLLSWLPRLPQFPYTMPSEQFSYCELLAMFAKCANNADPELRQTALVEEKPCPVSPPLQQLCRVMTENCLLLPDNLLDVRIRKRKAIYECCHAARIFHPDSYRDRLRFSQ